MSCGCGTPVGITIAGRSGHRYTPDQVTAAAMCVACPFRNGEVCRVSGLNARKDHALLLDCWLGWHPRGGTLGFPFPFVRWYGVPYPVRAWLWLRRKISRPSALPGCGCLAILKDQWDLFRFLIS